MHPPKSRRTLLLLSLAAAAACGRVESAREGRAPVAAPVEVAEVRTRELADTIDAVGTVAAWRRVDVRARIDGVIAELLFAAGERVEAGRPLVRFDDRKARARLELARAALESARARLAVAEQKRRRHRSLLEQHLISPEAFEAVDAEYRAAAALVEEKEAAVALAQRELDDYHLDAPIGGVVGDWLVDPGNYVDRGARITTIVTLDPVRVRFSVPDRYASRISPGLAVRVAPVGSARASPGTVDLVSARIDPATRMLPVRATVANPQGALRDGQFVKVTLELGARRARPVVPEQAVLVRRDGVWVYVVEGSVARRRSVTLGRRFGSEVEVTAGLEPGELVVVAGQHRLTDGAPVTVVDADAALR